MTIVFDDIGTVSLPRSYFDDHELPSGEIGPGLDHAYAVTSYAVQGSTAPTSTSRLDARSNRSEAYVDVTRGTDANHLYLTPTDMLEGEQLPHTIAADVDTAVAERLRRSEGERTAWEIRESTGRDRSPSLHGTVGV